ncbi:MAG: hypothetical protein M1833_005217 [Piccolia ochrophora]|nr:MAG: hypothetical protein M1833_005217 [Piccolia ochrophora]
MAFRNLQHYIAQSKIDPQRPDDYYEDGYAILRQCSSQAQALLSASFSAMTPQGQAGNAQQERVQLQRILLDAHTRRFQAQKIYLRAMAARQWALGRHSVLQGQKPQPAHAAALQALDNNLRIELANISDERVYADLRSTDFQAGRWVAEDPSLSAIRQWALSQH